MQILKTGFSGGGFGPGAYYPWVYLQMVILIPLMRPICDKLGRRVSFLTFIVLCESIEVICSLTDMPDAIYRLLCLRYVMLIWFGWMWVKDGIIINQLTIIVSLVSLSAIIYLAYFCGDNEPWIYNTGWMTHRWMSYFWVSWLFVGVLYGFYKKLVRFDIVKKIVSILAAASYEIFLVQMAYYATVPMQRINLFGGEVMMFASWFALAFVVSIAGGLLLNELEKNYIKY